MEIRVHPEGLAEWEGGEAPVILGRTGIRRDKREGDGATPVGVFPIRGVLWRADRLPRPATDLPCIAIAEDDGWCDDPDDPAYNQPVKRPYPASHEALWRDDHLYDVVVVIGHNDSPVVPGAGSAVFLHLARPDRGPTAGCVAFAREDLLRLLRVCDVTTTIRVVPADDHAG